jgi:hypothetical protein
MIFSPPGTPEGVRAVPVRSVEDLVARLQAALTMVGTNTLRRARDIALRRAFNGRRPLRTRVLTTRGPCVDYLIVAFAIGGDVFLEN